jgi:hypothetical protein
MNYGNHQKGNPPPPQTNERLSRVKELAVTTALQIVTMETQQVKGSGKGIYEDFIDTYRALYKEFTAPAEDE